MQHYTEFDSHTITTLEKILLGVGFFGTTMNHLACCQIILLIISRVLGLFLVVWFTTLAFWGIGFWLFLHLSFVSSKIITLFFSMSWHMLKSSLFPSSSHCGISKLYYPKLFIFKSPTLKVLWYSCIFIHMFFYEPFTQIRICHNFNRCHMNMSLILCKSNHEHLVISMSCHIYISFSFCTFLGFSHPIVAHFSHC